jgi:hypothetical protein
VSATGSPPARAGTAWYVYGVVPTGTPPAPLEGAPGLGGGPVKIVGEGGLGAVVSEVPLAEFDDEPLAANLHDPVWLEAGVRRHDAVLAAVVRAGAVVPFRFGTIYRSEDQVLAMLAEHPGLTAALEAVRGRIELGVKGFAREPEAQPASEAEGSSPSGRRYLEQKQQARRAAEERESLLGRAADDSHARLAVVADEARANPLQPREASGGEGEMFLNGAYLVSTARQEAFRQTVDALGAELASSGLMFELTGPWPPYNFVEVEP